jgi:hypothetical protein
MKAIRKGIGLPGLLICLLILGNPVRGQSRPTGFGYLDKGDSIEFIFGQQKIMIVSGTVVNLQERFNEIKSVNVAGDFNNWNPKDAKYVAVMGTDKLFRLVVAKKNIGKKGETRQFKFVLNQVHWVEPPAEAANRYTGKDGYTNLTVKL